MIGCVMVSDTVYFPASATVPAPGDFPLHSPGPKGYDVGANGSPEVTAAVAQMSLLAPDGPPGVDYVWHHVGPRFGAPSLKRPRSGQGAFKARVADAYGLRCAITGAKVRPALQAAHIRPYEKEGPHRVDNGLLLRADVHLMFDAGYLGVEPRSHKLLVSKEIRDAFGQGVIGPPGPMPARLSAPGYRARVGPSGPWLRCGRADQGCRR